MSNEVQRLLGCMNSREIQVLSKLVTAQKTIADGQYMNGIYLPNLEDRLNKALIAARQRENPKSDGKGEVDHKNADGVDYKIVFKSNDQVRIIKFFRDVWAMGLKEAKDLSDMVLNRDFEWNVLVVRNDTKFNMENARALVETYLKAQGTWNRPAITPDIRIESIDFELKQ